MGRRLIIGCVVFVCICGVAVFAAGFFLVEQERAEVRETYGEEVAALCDPPSGGVANTANMPPADGGLQVLVLQEGDSQRHAFHKDLPDELRADDSAELDVVACMVPMERTVESCDYGDEGSEETDAAIERVQKYYQVFLINPEGNQRISEFEVLGGEPPACPSQAALADGEIKKEKGADVVYNDFEVALRSALSQ